MNNEQKLKVATDALERLCTHSVRSSKQIDADWDNARATLAMLSLLASPSTEQHAAETMRRRSPASATPTLAAASIAIERAAFDAWADSMGYYPHARATKWDGWMARAEAGPISKDSGNAGHLPSSVSIKMYDELSEEFDKLEAEHEALILERDELRAQLARPIELELPVGDHRKLVELHRSVEGENIHLCVVILESKYGAEGSYSPGDISADPCAASSVAEGAPFARDARFDILVRNLRDEIRHCESNNKRLEPDFGKSAGVIAVPSDYIEAAIEGALRESAPIESNNDGTQTSAKPEAPTVVELSRFSVTARFNTTEQATAFAESLGGATPVPPHANEI